MSKRSQWTIDTLKQLMDERFTAQEKAILKAEGATEKRFDSVNEFRSQLKDQASTFITRHEMDNIVESIKRLESFQAQVQGSMAQGTTGRLQNNWIIGIIVTLVISAASIIIALMKHS